MVPVAHHIQEVLQGPYNTLPRVEQPLPPTPHSYHMDISGNSDLIGATLQIYLLEVIYLGVTAPTRNRTELHIFKQHCLFLLQNHTEKHISHPLTELQTITPHIGCYDPGPLPQFSAISYHFISLSITRPSLVPSRAAQTATKSPDKSPDGPHD